MEIVDTNTRWVIWRPDGKFVGLGNLWVEDIGKAHTWVCEDLAKRAAEIVGGDACARKAKLTISLELDDETTDKEEKQ